MPLVNSKKMLSDVGALSLLFGAVLYESFYRLKNMRYYNVFVQEAGSCHVAMTHPTRSGWVVFRYENKLMQCLSGKLCPRSKNLVTINISVEMIELFTVEPF